MVRGRPPAWAWSAVAAGVVAAAVVVPWLARLPRASPVSDGDRRWAAPVEPEPGGGVDPVLVRPFDGDGPVSQIFTHGSFTHAKATWGKHLNLRGGVGYVWRLPSTTPVRAAIGGLVVGDVADGDVFIRGERYNVEYRGLDAVAKPGDVVREGDPVGMVVGGELALNVYRRGPEARPVDPYGHAAGGHCSSGSLWLWKDGQAPPVYDEAVVPNLAAVGSPFTDAVVRYVSWDDDHHPNGEWVDLHGLPGASLDRVSVRTLAGDRFKFPQGDVVPADGLVRVYSGDGQDGGGTYFWGRSRDAWRDGGDCLRLDLGDRTLAVGAFGGASRLDCGDLVSVNGLPLAARAAAKLGG